VPRSLEFFIVEQRQVGTHLQRMIWVCCNSYRGKTGVLRQEPIQNARQTPLLGFGGNKPDF
jgi:hypothetical protein